MQEGAVFAQKVFPLAAQKGRERRLFILHRTGKRAISSGKGGGLEAPEEKKRSLPENRSVVSSEG